jgi:hypothetical protein
MSIEPEASAPENRALGAILALIATLPGILIWVVIWNFGFLAGVGSLVSAVLAGSVYAGASGGRIGKGGRWIVIGILFAGFVASVYFGLATDYIRAGMRQSGLGAFDVLSAPGFWPAFHADFVSIAEAESPDIFGAFILGTFATVFTLRPIFKSATAAYPEPPISQLNVSLAQPVLAMSANDLEYGVRATGSTTVTGALAPLAANILVPAAPLETIRQRKALGLVAMIVAVTLVVASTVVAVANGTHLDAEHISDAEAGGLVVDFLLGTALGVWALVQGIVAVAVRRGRVFGTVAIVLASATPLLSLISFGITAAITQGV